MKFIFSFFFLGLFGQLQAQEGIEYGGHVGIAYYFGDLNTNYNLSQPGYLVGLKFRRNYNERLSLTAAIDYGLIRGSDKVSNNAFERNRNLDFHSQIIDGSVSLEFNFFPYIHGSEEEYYTPYIFGGLSLLRYSPKTTLDGVSYTLRDFGTEGQTVGAEYGFITPALVFGLGFKLDINRDWSINVQVSGRNVFSDHIDDVSGLYGNPSTLESRRGEIAPLLANRSLDPEFGRPETQRGNGKNNDIIYYFSIGVMRYIGYLRCPPISKIRE